MQKINSKVEKETLVLYRALPSFTAKIMAKKHKNIWFKTCKHSLSTWCVHVARMCWCGWWWYKTISTASVALPILWVGKYRLFQYPIICDTLVEEEERKKMRKRWEVTVQCTLYSYTQMHQRSLCISEKKKILEPLSESLWSWSVIKISHLLLLYSHLHSCFTLDSAIFRPIFSHLIIINVLFYDIDEGLYIDLLFIYN